MVALVIDALTDPMVGSFSDNLRSRLGRRHPLMYLASVPLGFFLYLVFSPPDRSVGSRTVRVASHVRGRYARFDVVLPRAVERAVRRILRRLCGANRDRHVSLSGRLDRRRHLHVRHVDVHFPELCRVYEGAAESNGLSPLRADPRFARGRSGVPDNAPDAQRDSVSAATGRSSRAVLVEARVRRSVACAAQSRLPRVVHHAAHRIGHRRHHRGAEHLRADVLLGVERRSAALVRARDPRIHRRVRRDAGRAGALRQETSRHLRPGVPRRSTAWR